MKPKRIQLQRTKGWRMPANTVKVDRTTRWGNPFTLEACGTREAAVARYGEWLNGAVVAPANETPLTPAEIRLALRGKNLACWCPLDGPCHSNTLLKIANSLGGATRKLS